MGKTLSWINSNEMSEPLLLVRHPAPYPTESLFGYLLRLSELNGYQNIAPMMSLAGMKEKAARKLGMKVQSIASISNRSIEELEAIAHYDPANSYARLAGHKVLRAHLRRLRPAICPECVEEKGYIEAQWELLAMTGCPIHKRGLLTSCKSCGKRLTWFRPGLLVCSCGETLTGVALPILGSEEADLLEVIRCCVLRLPSETDNSSRLPISDLSRMDLYPLLTLLRALGRDYHRIGRAAAERYSSGSTAGAARVLSDWPNGLFRMLEAMMATDTSAGFARGNLSRLYFSLFRSRAIPDRTLVEFAKRAFVDFAAKHWGNGGVVKKLLRPYDIDDPEHYLTPGALAKRLNIHHNTVRALVKNGTVPHLTIEARGVERTLIDSRAINISPLLPGRLLMVRKAAAEIGVSVALLRALRDSGDYEVRSAPACSRGFHEADLENFIGRIKSIALMPPLNAKSEVCLTIGTALHELRHSLEAQVHLMHSVLTRDIRLIGSSSTTVADLQIPDIEFRSECEGKMPLWYRETSTSRAIGKQLGCRQEWVLGLVKYGHLEEKQTPIGMRITQKSAEEFANAFISLAAVATANDTSARSLVSTCQSHGIFMLTIEKNHINASFVRREDAQLVVEHVQLNDQRKLGGVRSQAERTEESDGGKAVIQLHSDGPPLMPSYAKQDRSPCPNTLSWKSASDEMECSRDGISLLIAQGLLAQRQTSLGSRITKRSLTQFKRKFISMAELSRIEATKPRKLRRLCVDNNIPVITVRSRLCNHSFIRRKDRDSVLNALAISRTAL